MKKALGVAILILLPSAAFAQQQPPLQWSKLPHMQLERQFAGPLQDTIVQRWRDPVDGTTCYIYLPITAQHSPPTASGYVQYGPNTIGSITCMLLPPAPAAAAAAAPPHAPAAPAKSAAAPRARAPTLPRPAVPAAPPSGNQGEPQ